MQLRAKRVDFKRIGKLSVKVVCLNIGGDLLLPPVAVVEKLLFVVEQLFPGFCAEFEVGAFHNGVYWTSLLTQAAVDTLGHVNVVPGRPPAAILSLFRLDRDRLNS